MSRPPVEPIEPLDDRKQSILRAVVDDYVRTVEPVGSRWLMTHYSFGVRSATLRNEMAELSERGYLRQPHTSAGRIPSDLGYRFYVDRLMPRPELPAAEADSARSRLAPRSSELDAILEQTCRVLSDLARYTSVATDPVLEENSVTHVSVAGVSPGKLLAVVVLDNGVVLHELIDSHDGVDPVRVSNYLSSKLVGRSLSSIQHQPVQESPDDPPGAHAVLARVVDFLRRQAEAAEGPEVYLGGTGYILQQPEFKQAERLEALLTVLEQRQSLYRLLSSLYLGPEVTVMIGRENPVDAAQELSFVCAKYTIGGRVAGTIGVVGPTRMDYRRAVAAVDFMARNLSDLLTTLSLG